MRIFDLKNLAVLFLTIIIIGVNGYTKDWRCVDVMNREAYNCEGVGCQVRKIKSNQGFCATANEFIVKDLNPGEQMCCTQNEAIVRKVDPGFMLVCNRFQAVAYPVNQSRLEKYEMACCNADKCGYEELNLYKYQKLGCTATESFIAEADGPDWGIGCTNNLCFQTPLKKGEQMACKRFNNLPVAENELKSFGHEVEKVAGFLNSKERCKQNPFHGEFTRDSGERTADQSYQSDSYASVCSNP